MYALTLKLLQMGLRGALLILLAALIRFALFRVLPKGMLRLLWVPAILALLIPIPALFHLSLPLPELGRAETASPEAEYARMDWDSWEAAPEPESPGILALEPAAGERGRAGLPLLSLVWLAGAGFLGLGVLALYLREYARFRRAVPLAGAEAWLCRHPLRRRLRLRLMPGLSSPMTYGVFRPAILLPEEPDWDRLPDLLALEHEYVHVRHLDAAWKLLLHLLLILHWYDPAVWLMYALLSRDLELSCDETVLRRFGRERRTDFAQMLVDRGRRSLAPFPGLGAGVLRERVNAIMRYRRAGVLRRCLAFCLVLGLCLCALCTLRVGAVEETLYRNGGMVLSVPRELKDLLIVETPALTGETEEVLFRVLERETWEAGKELYPDSRREYGLIFTVQRMDEAAAAKSIQNRLASWDLLARDEQGYYYMVKRASVEANMLTSPETEDQNARWERRKLVNAWVRDLRASVSWQGRLHTRYPAYSSTVSAHLAGALFNRGRRYRLVCGEERVDIHGENEGSEFLSRLTWETAAESVRILNEPQGEPIAVTHPYRQRVLYFWPGSEQVLYCSDTGAPDNVRYWYTVTLLDSPGEKVGDLVAAWFRWAKENQGE